MSISWSISLNDLLDMDITWLTCHSSEANMESGNVMPSTSYWLLQLFPFSRTVKHGMTQKLNSDSRETNPSPCSLRAEGYFLYISPRDNISNSSSQWTKTLMNLYFTCSNRNRFGRIFEHISVGWDMIFHPITQSLSHFLFQWNSPHPGQYLRRHIRFNNIAISIINLWGNDCNQASPWSLRQLFSHQSKPLCAPAHADLHETDYKCTSQSRTAVIHVRVLLWRHILISDCLTWRSMPHTAQLSWAE